jgi:DNA-binding MarR family transcriptional regulator
MSARIVLHLAGQPRFDRRERVPGSLTQEGIAERLAVPQGTVSSSLKRLVEGGILRVELGHVQGKLRRLKVYQLTDYGEFVAQHITASMAQFGKGRSPQPPLAPRPT